MLNHNINALTSDRKRKYIGSPSRYHRKLIINRMGETRSLSLGTFIYDFLHTMLLPKMLWWHHQNSTKNVAAASSDRFLLFHVHSTPLFYQQQLKLFDISSDSSRYLIESVYNWWISEYLLVIMISKYSFMFKSKHLHGGSWKRYFKSNVIVPSFFFRKKMLIKHFQITVDRLFGYIKEWRKKLVCWISL